MYGYLNWSFFYHYYGAISTIVSKSYCHKPALSQVQGVWLEHAIDCTRWRLVMHNIVAMFVIAMLSAVTTIYPLGF